MSNTTTPAEIPSPNNPPNTSANPRAYTSPASWLRFLIPAAIGTATDLALKAWAFPDGVPAPVIPPALDPPAGRHPAVILDDFMQQWVNSEPTPIIPHVLGFTTTVNHGAVFGKFQGYVPVFLAFSFVALAVIIWVFATSFRKQWTVHIALGLITAGALGNLYDRAIYHGVRDMLKFYVSWYPYIFNIADALLCVGVPILILRWLFTKDPTKTQSES